MSLPAKVPAPPLPHVGNLGTGTKIAWWDITHHLPVPQADATAFVIVLIIAAIVLRLAWKMARPRSA